MLRVTKQSHAQSGHKTQYSTVLSCREVHTLHTIVHCACSPHPGSARSTAKLGEARHEDPSVKRAEVLCDTFDWEVRCDALRIHATETTTQLPVNNT